MVHSILVYILAALGTFPSTPTAVLVHLWSEDSGTRALWGWMQIPLVMLTASVCSRQSATIAGLFSEIRRYCDEVQFAGCMEKVLDPGLGARKMISIFPPNT